MPLVPIVSPEVDIDEIGVSPELYEKLKGNFVQVKGLSNTKEPFSFVPTKLDIDSRCVAFHPLILAGFSADFDGTFIVEVTPEEKK